MTLTNLTPPTLRYYQVDADRAVSEAFSRGIYRQLVVLPTGSGKTVLFAQFPTGSLRPWLETKPEQHRKIMVIAHREELLDQAARKIATANPHLYVDVEQAGRHASVCADVVVASVQTLAARGGKRLSRFFLDQFAVLCCDESHHATASTYQSIMQEFGFLPPDSFMPRPPCARKSADLALQHQRMRLAEWDTSFPMDKLLVGLTATPMRGDDIGLEAIFQEIVYTRHLRQLIKEGFLSRMRAIRVTSDVSLDHVKVQAGDFAQGALSDAVDTPDRNMIAVKAYKQYAPGRKAIAFCVSVEHAEDMADAFKSADIPCEAIHGNMDSEQRKRILADLHTGTIQVLTNCQIAVEGFDEPSVDCIIHARPTKSKLFYHQASGRGARLFPGKEDCLIIDIVDVTRKHSLSGAADLVGLPAGFDLQGEDLNDVADMADDLKAQGLLQKTPYDASALKRIKVRAEEADLGLGNASDPMEPKLAVLRTNLLWIQANAQSIYLSFTTGEPKKRAYLEVEKTNDGQFAVVHTDLRSFARRIAVLPTLQQAVTTAESWLLRTDQQAFNYRRKSQPWHKLPASQPQLDLIETLGGGDKIMFGMTKGQAGLLIDGLNRLHSQRDHFAYAGQTRRAS